MPASLDSVADTVRRFPGVTEGSSYGHRAWFVNSTHFAWERPFSKADLKRFGDESPPTGPILAVRLADLGEKDAVLAEGRTGFFTISHFDNYPALLVALRRARAGDVREVLEDAWLAVAPPELTERYLAAKKS